jgi:hypothetical protein
LGEGAAPVISFPSIQLRFTGPRGGHRRFFRPAQKEAADVAQPTAKTSKSLPSTVFSENDQEGMPAAR